MQIKGQKTSGAPSIVVERKAQTKTGAGPVRVSVEEWNGATYAHVYGFPVKGGRLTLIVDAVPRAAQILAELAEALK